MKIDINPRHLETSDALESWTREKISALHDLNSEIVSAHVILSHDQNANPETHFTASARLAVAGPDLFAEEHSDSIYSAVEAVASKLARQLRKRKTRLTDKRRSDVQRVIEREKKGIE